MAQNAKQEVNATPFKWCDPSTIPPRTAEERAKYEQVEACDYELDADALILEYAKLEMERAVEVFGGEVRDGRAYLRAPGHGAEDRKLEVWFDRNRKAWGGWQVINHHTSGATNSRRDAHLYFFDGMGWELPEGIARPANDNEPGAKKPKAAIQGIDAETLLTAEFPPIRFVVPGYVVEGLTILAGRPKLGKSWLALNIAMAVAGGSTAMGAVECEAGDVLYLALEDNERRLQSRVRTLIPKMVERPNLSRLALATEAPRLDQGLIDSIDGWRIGATDPRLVIVDTFAKVRPPRKRTQDSYEADYAAVAPLQRYAAEHGLAIMLVTHTRKSESDDPLEMVSGTNGQTGAADSILVLNRDANGPKLYGRGRDIDDVDAAMSFDAGRWVVVGNADEVQRSGERKRIMEALEEAGRALGPQEIAAEAGMKPGNVKYLLRKMVEAGEAEKVGYGAYKPASTVAATS